MIWLLFSTLDSALPHALAILGLTPKGFRDVSGPKPGTVDQEEAICGTVGVSWVPQPVTPELVAPVDSFWAGQCSAIAPPILPVPDPIRADPVPSFELQMPPPLGESSLFSSWNKNNKRESSDFQTRKTF